MRTQFNTVVLDGYTLNPGDLSWDALKKICNVTVYDKTLPEEIFDRAKEADAVLTNKVILSKETMEKLPRLKYIGVLATGYNVVDVNAANEKGICVTNIPSYSTDSVAQSIFAFILNFFWHIKDHSDEVLNGKWASSEHFCYHSYPLHELSFKTIGIIGFGHIGQTAAKIALSMNMKVIYVNRSKKSIIGLEEAKQVTLDELLSASDIISLNCPLTAETNKIVNTETLQKMKPSVYLVNTGRGTLVDEEAVAKALIEKRIAGFACDVLSTEPPAANNPLLSAPNCTITPHIAWQTSEARNRLMEIAVNNVQAFITGKPINQVNN